MKMRHSPHNSQCLQLCYPVFSLRIVQGSTGIRYRVRFPIQLHLAEYGSKAMYRSIGFKDEIHLEVWVSQDGSRDDSSLQLLVCSMTFWGPLENNVLTCEVMKGVGYFGELWYKLTVIRTSSGLLNISGLGISFHSLHQAGVRLESVARHNVSQILQILLHESTLVGFNFSPTCTILSITR